MRHKTYIFILCISLFFLAACTKENTPLPIPQMASMQVLSPQETEEGDTTRLGLYLGKKVTKETKQISLNGNSSLIKSP